MTLIIDWFICVCAHSLCCVQLFVSPQTVACQAPLFMGLSKQEYWSGLPCPSSEDLTGPGIRPMPPTSPALEDGSLPMSHLGRPCLVYIMALKIVILLGDLRSFSNS